jgi:hypothetical protein
MRLLGAVWLNLENKRRQEMKGVETETKRWLI